MPLENHYVLISQKNEPPPPRVSLSKTKGQATGNLLCAFTRSRVNICCNTRLSPSAKRQPQAFRRQNQTEAKENGGSTNVLLREGPFQHLHIIGIMQGRIKAVRGSCPQPQFRRFLMIIPVVLRMLYNVCDVCSTNHEFHETQQSNHESTDPLKSSHKARCRC